MIHTQVPLFCHYHQTLTQVDEALEFLTPFPGFISNFGHKPYPTPSASKKKKKAPSGCIHCFFITVVKYHKAAYRRKSLFAIMAPVIESIMEVKDGNKQQT